MLGLFLFLSLAFGDAICADGWYSSSTGRCTCSHHGGVVTWVVPNAPVYTQPTPKVSNESFLTIEGDLKIWRDSNGEIHRLNGPAIIYYLGPNKHVEIFCREGVWEKVSVFFDQKYTLTIDFSSRRSSFGEIPTQDNTIVYSKSLEWSRYFISDEILKLMIDVGSFTDENGVTYTLSRKGL